MKSSVIIPAYNEEKALPLVIEEYLPFADEIIIVDDGSTDKTYEVAKKYNVKVYRHEKNLGKVAAIREGIRNAAGDIIILTDADYTYPAKYIPIFIREIENGADLVLGSRFIEKTKNIPLLNSIGNVLFSLLTSYISGVAISDGQTGYRAFKKEMFEKFDVNAKGLEFETKMTVKVAKLGYTICEVPIEYRARIGQSKLSPIYDGCKMFSSIVSIAISETSLLAKVMILPSIFFVFFGLYFGVISVFQKIRYGVVKHDFYPLLTAFFILLAIQLISFGLLIDNLTKKLDRIEEKFRKS